MALIKLTLSHADSKVPTQMTTLQEDESCSPALSLPSERTFVSEDDGLTFSVRWASSTGYTDPSSIERLAANARLSVLYEDAELLVVDKPAYLPCENTATLKDSVRTRMERHVANGACVTTADGQPARTLHLPHRLDWETSGVLVIAKTKGAMASLSRQFAEREMTKVYTADVLGALPTPSGSVALPLSADPSRQPRQRVDFGATGKACLTRWSVVRTASLDGHTASRLRLAPHTGRRHQLRVHMAATGCAIAGDALYMEPPLKRELLSRCEPEPRQDSTPLVPAVATSPALEDAPATTAPSALALTQPLAPAAAAASVAAGERPLPRLHLHASELGFRHPCSGEWKTFQSVPPFVLEDAWSCGLGSGSAKEVAPRTPHAPPPISR